MIAVAPSLLNIQIDHATSLELRTCQKASRAAARRRTLFRCCLSRTMAAHQNCNLTATTSHIERDTPEACSEVPFNSWVANLVPLTRSVNTDRRQTTKHMLI